MYSFSSFLTCLLSAVLMSQVDNNAGHDLRASNLIAPSSGELLAKLLAKRAQLWL